jgi:hypothetical protein
LLSFPRDAVIAHCSLGFRSGRLRGCRISQRAITEEREEAETKCDADSSCNACAYAFEPVVSRNLQLSSDKCINPKEDEYHRGLAPNEKELSTYHRFSLGTTAPALADHPSGLAE